VHAAVVIGVSALACACLGLVFRWHARRLTLVSMGTYTGMRAGRSTSKGAPRGQRAPDAELAASTNQAVGTANQAVGTANQAGAIGSRRLLASVVLAATALPLITVVLAAWRQHLNSPTTCSSTSSRL